MKLGHYLSTTQSGKRELDALGAYVVLALAVAFFPIQFLVDASSIYLRAIPVVLAAASGLYLLSKRSGNADPLGTKLRAGDPSIDYFRLSSRTAHVVRMTTVIGLAGLLFVATVTGGRSVQFVGVAALVGSLIFVQIFFHPRRALHPSAVLAQIVVFALVVRSVALVTTPGLIGVDSWVHITDYAHSIRESGQLAAISDVKYYGAPLYHLLVVVAADVFHSSLRTALYATLGIAVPLSVLLIYVQSQYFLPVRYALFATAAYGVADHFVRWGTHIIPNSMGLVFFVAVLYGITKMYATGKSIPLYGLTIFFAVGTVLTHQLSAFITLVFLGVGMAVQLYVRFLGSGAISAGRSIGRRTGHHVNFAALFLVVCPFMVANWLVSPSSRSSFVETMFAVAIAGISRIGLFEIPSETTVSTGPIETLVLTTPFTYQLLDALGLLLLLLVTIVGSFAVLRRQHLESLPLMWVLSSGTMLVVTLGLPLLGLFFLLPDRWFAFMYVPMVMLGGCGLWHLEFNLRPRRFVAILVVVALLFPGAMLATDEATRENPINEKYQPQYAHTESELTATKTISTIHPDGEILATDQRYRLLFRDWQHESTAPLNLTENGTTSDEFVVYRQSQSVDGPRVEFKDTLVRVQLPPDAVCRPSMDVVYSNGDVQYCRSTRNQ